MLFYSSVSTLCSLTHLEMQLSFCFLWKLVESERRGTPEEAVDGQLFVPCLSLSCFTKKEKRGIFPAQLNHMWLTNSEQTCFSSYLCKFQTPLHPCAFPGNNLFIPLCYFNVAWKNEFFPQATICLEGTVWEQLAGVARHLFYCMELRDHW